LAKFPSRLEAQLANEEHGMTLLNLLKANPTLQQPTVLNLVPAVSLRDVLSVMSVIAGGHAENGCGEQIDVSARPSCFEDAVVDV
jgi:hypothetical protein